MKSNFSVIINFYGSVNSARFETREAAEAVQTKLQEAINELGKYNRDKQSTEDFTDDLGGKFVVSLKDILSIIVEDLEINKQFNIEMALESARATKFLKQKAEEEGLTDVMKFGVYKTS